VSAAPPVAPASDPAPRLAAAGLILEQAEADGGIHYLLRGATFAHREQLKALGARWSQSRRAWVVVDAALLARLAAALDGRDSAPPGLAEAPAVPFQPPRPHYLGHRQRLRERFMAGPPDALPDYELLELLLFFSIPKVDVKPLAKQLLAEFGSLGGVLAAPAVRLAAFPPIDQFTVVHLRAVQALLPRVLAEGIRARPLIGGAQALLDYLQVALAHEPVEQFRVLFLDRQNRLIKDEQQQRGTVDHTPVYPRELARRALELGASAVIMVHNHPSGDPTPSRADLDMTRQAAAALAAVGVTLHDHLIIGQGRHTSFVAEGLL
jgi:DNA repair protein RadC